MLFIYRIFAYLGLMSFPAFFFIGFGYDANAPVDNLYFNIGIYVAFIVVHLMMSMPGFKKALYGATTSTAGERRIYIIMTVVTWVAVVYFHKPVTGLALEMPYPFWTDLLGYAIGLIGLFIFLENADRAFLDAFLGVSDELSHSTGAETPLMTEGAYASVRHPMYFGVMVLGTGCLILHPHMGQLVFTAMVGLSFIGFIPIEESMLIKARGQEYLDYKKKVPYRVFKGIW